MQRIRPTRWSAEAKSNCSALHDPSSYAHGVPLNALRRRSCAIRRSGCSAGDGERNSTSDEQRRGGRADEVRGDEHDAVGEVQSTHHHREANKQRQGAEVSVGSVATIAALCSALLWIGPAVSECPRAALFSSRRLMRCAALVPLLLFCLFTSLLSSAVCGAVHTAHRATAEHSSSGEQWGSAGDERHTEECCPSQPRPLPKPHGAARLSRPRSSCVCTNFPSETGAQPCRSTCPKCFSPPK